MIQFIKMPFMWFLLNILKPNYLTCDWLWADGSHLRHQVFEW